MKGTPLTHTSVARVDPIGVGIAKSWSMSSIVTPILSTNALARKHV